MRSAYPLAPIGELVSFVGKWNPCESPTNKLFTYIDIASINRETKQVEEAVQILTHNAPSRARQIVKTGDILISTVRPNLNAVAHLNSQFDGATASTGFTVLRTKPQKLDSRYLYYWVRTSYFIENMVRRSTGASYPAVSDSIIKKSGIPLPPLEEQRRIATILDKADAVRRKRQQAIALTEELLRSAFLEMFGDPIANPKGWENKRFGDVGTLERGKSQHRPRNDPSLLGGLHPLIQTGEIANCNGVVRSYTQTYSEKGLAQSRMWAAGTLCINIAANIAQTGILAFDACFPDSIVGFQAKSEVVTEYVQGWLRFLQPLIEERAPQVAQKNINLQILRELELPVPPIKLQKKYSEFTLLLRKHIISSEQYQKDLDGLFNSILQRVFRGEL